MISEQLDLWADEVDALPWGGRSPRLLAIQIVRERLDRFVAMATGGVDNSVVGCQSREALRIAANPAQLTICVSSPSRRR